jgi:hypothetical protein
MLPALNPTRPSLADVLESCFGSLTSSANRLDLPGVDSAIVVLIDGLGAEVLRARAGHARIMTSALTSKSIIESGFPTTTAAAIATLTTGTAPGVHGLVGYTVLDSHGRMVNQLSGWDAQLDPASWQLRPTIFERASDAGFSPIVVGPERYRNSGYTRAVLRGAKYVSGASIAERMQHAAALARQPGSLLYVYVPELDQAAHAHGWQSSEWTNALESTDSALADLQRSLGSRTGLLVTADHGVLDVDRGSHILIDSAPELVDGVRFVAGEPRCLQLHFEPDLPSGLREALIDRWRASESNRAWVVTRQEGISAGWFGPVDPRVEPRIGDLLVAARKNVAYYDGRAGASGRSMIGQHGSWTAAELRVPLLRFGAFARA